MRYCILKDINLKLRFTEHNKHWCDESDTDIFRTLKKDDICTVNCYPNWRLDIIYKDETLHLYNLTRKYGELNKTVFDRMFYPLSELREERINKILN